MKENKTYLITGATSGMGKALAYHLSNNRNYQIVILGRNIEKLNQVAKETNSTLAIQFDLQNLDKIEEIFQTVSNNKILLDGLIHCAGISPLMTVKDNNIKTMLETFNTNLFSFIELCKYFANDKYCNKGSSIIAISSIAAKCASYRQTVYSSSKAAIEEAVRCIAKEFLQYNTRVNCIAPGAVNTEMLSELMKKSVGLKEKFEKLYPLGLIPTNYISEMIEFLLSDKSKYITGRCIDIDAGFLTAK